MAKVAREDQNGQNNRNGKKGQNGEKRQIGKKSQIYLIRMASMGKTAKRPKNQSGRIGHSGQNG